MSPAPPSIATRLFGREPLRLDARALGAFRIAMGAALLVDLAQRWAQARDLYSNDGVLSNHQHLYLQRDTGAPWSLLHAFSSQADAKFAFVLFGIAYLLFTVGFATRVLHALALAAAVSLAGRNVLLESPVDHVAIGLLALTLWLPCGSRLSVDALLASFAGPKESGPHELGARPPEPGESDEADHRASVTREPGFSPTSLAALGASAWVAGVHAAMALGHADLGAPGVLASLLVQPIASASGASLAEAGWLSALGAGLVAAEWTVAVLALAPLGLLPTSAQALARGVGAAVGVAHAVAIGWLFDFGPLPWFLAAGSLLLVPRAWFAWLASRPSPARTRTVIFDEDCGICFTTVRLLARLDWRHHLVLQGNGSLEALWVRDAAAPGDGELPPRVGTKPMPAEVTPELVNDTIVVVEPNGTIHLRARAVSAIVHSLPLGPLVAWVMRVPGLSALFDRLYRLVATNRLDLSVAMGLGACGIAPPAKGARRGAVASLTPAQRTARVLRTAGRELAALLVVAGVVGSVVPALSPGLEASVGPLAQPAREAAESWLRVRGDVAFAATRPALPPASQEVVVVKATLKEGGVYDPLRGGAPLESAAALHGPDARARGLGFRWRTYLSALLEPRGEPFRKPFREWLTKGGRGDHPTESLIQGVVVEALPWMGGPSRVVLTHGRAAGDFRSPLLEFRRDP